MRAIKNKNKSDFKAGKTIIIIFEIAILLTLTVIVCFVIKGDISLKAPDGAKNSAEDTTSEIVYKEGLTFGATEENKNQDDDFLENIENIGNFEHFSHVADNAENKNENVTKSENKSDNPVKNEGTPTVSQNAGNTVLADPSDWSKSEILLKAKEAVRKTKSYSGNLTVNHSESFVADVTECTGGDIVKTVVNLMLGWVVKPVQETLLFQNGTAVNSEGETVPIILPKRGEFSLTESGVKSASVQRAGSEYVIKINLVEESVGMNDVPKHNAASIGYLDVANFDISFMEVDSADIVYKGSSIELKINAEGYVTYANYKIPLHIDGSAHRGSISGSATFDGEQTEEWKLNW